MGVSTLWGIRGIYAGYSWSIHRIYVCIGYVSGMYRVCIGKVSKGTGSEEPRIGLIKTLKKYISSHCGCSSASLMVVLHCSPSREKKSHKWRFFCVCHKNVVPLHGKIDKTILEI